MAWKKIDIIRDNGELAQAAAPVIISASRSTDIPAFYADWFFNRLEKGYCAWTNPFNGVQSYVSFADTRFIVFWSKNPQPLLPHLETLSNRDIGCYIQYTLNDYEGEGLERGVPTLQARIDTFKRLVDTLGYGRVVWRFDPMLLTDAISVDLLLQKVSNIGDQLKGYTEKLVFSFADIEAYKKVKMNLDKSGVKYNEWNNASMLEFAKRLSALNKERGWNFILATCGEKVDLQQYGIGHNRCVDDELIIRCAWQHPSLMEYLNVEIGQLQPTLFDVEQLPLGAIALPGNHYALKKKDNKDKGQRQFCGCIVSKDIGQYNTCPHQCEYCYANTSKSSAIENYKRHLNNPNSETIIGL